MPMMDVSHLFRVQNPHAIYVLCETKGY